MALNAPPIQIEPQHWAIVAEILTRVVPGCEVRAFGSRAKGEAGTYSDLDLALAAQAPLSLSTLAELAAEFEDSALPFKVDVVDSNALSPDFRQVVEETAVRVLPA